MRLSASLWALAVAAGPGYGQIDDFRENAVDVRVFATISIGGNDVGFSNTLDSTRCRATARPN